MEVQIGMFCVHLKIVRLIETILTSSVLKSNGSGKTSLAVSTLWALTGTIDPRPLQDSKVSDVIHDSSKVRFVTSLP
jgi:hypothetical protein